MEIPTLVVGIGMGGIRVVQSYADIVKELGTENYYQFVAIDSNKGDLQNIIKRGYSIYTVPIDEGQYSIKNLIARCPYLYEGMQDKGIGAIRDRNYARFLLDINMSRVESTITDAMGRLIKNWQNRVGVKDPCIAIWVVHTLGGGTGSGTFPTLIVKIREIAEGIIKEQHITPIIYCVGILPSATNINDISTVKFDKKYTANSYAALCEIEKLSQAHQSHLTLKPFYPNDSPQKTISITQSPFDWYLLYGINEDALARLQGSTDEVVEEYLESANKVIAYTMYYLVHFPGGIENRWKVRHIESHRPFIVFGESEITIPLEMMKQYALENDALGKKPDSAKKTELLKKAESLVKDTQTEKLQDLLIEDACSTIVKSEKLRGLKYYIGYLQNAFNKEYIHIGTKFNDELVQVGESLKKKDWAIDQMRNFDSLGIEDKYRLVRGVVKQRIEDNKIFIDSWKGLPRVFKRKELEEQNKKNTVTLQTLAVDYQRYIQVRNMKKYVDANLGVTLATIIKSKDFGADNIVEKIRTRENELNEFGKRLGDSGIGRVMRLGVPDTQLEKLTLVDNPPSLNVNTISDFPDFIKKLNIPDNKMERLIHNRMELAANYSIKIELGLEQHTGPTITPSKELIIAVNERNQPLIDQYHNELLDWSVKIIGGTEIEPDVNPGTIAFVPLQCGIELEDTKDFVYRKREYKNGDLAKIVELDNIGIIFAHPEWFPDDEKVRRAFPKIYPEK